VVIDFPQNPFVGGDSPGGRVRLENRIELAPPGLGNDADPLALAIDLGVEQAEGFSLPQPQARSQDHGHPIAGRDRHEQGDDGPSWQRLYDALAGAGWCQYDQAAFPGLPGTLQGHQAEHRIPVQVAGKGVHHHAEQLPAADALGAEDPDDGVVKGVLEVACLPAVGTSRRSSINSLERVFGLPFTSV